MIIEVIGTNLANELGYHLVVLLVCQRVAYFLAPPTTLWLELTAKANVGGRLRVNLSHFFCAGTKATE